MKKPHITKNQVLKRIKGVAEQAKLARQLWGIQSAGYTLSVDMLKYLRTRYQGVSE